MGCSKVKMTFLSVACQPMIFSLESTDNTIKSIPSRRSSENGLATGLNRNVALPETVRSLKFGVTSRSRWRISISRLGAYLRASEESPGASKACDWRQIISLSTAETFAVSTHRRSATAAKRPQLFGADAPTARVIDRRRLESELNGKSIAR